VALRPGSQAVPPPALGRPAIIRPKGRPVAGNGRLEGRMRDRRAPPLPAGAARHTVPASHSHHSGSTLPPRRRAALCLRCGMRAAGEGVAAIMANLVVLAPWLIFGAVLAVICYRMLRSRTSAHRHRRGGS
jgi:hypothetical protein